MDLDPSCNGGLCTSMQFLYLGDTPEDEMISKGFLLIAQ